MIPRTILDRLGDRWTVSVLSALCGGPLRYTEIHLRIPTCSQKMLTQTLRGLERDGLLVRTVYAEVPPRVDYRLTERGVTLVAALRPLETWADQHMARDQSDALRSA
jgi:DNA-binding HxlR family transcriptional regulator